MSGSDEDYEESVARLGGSSSDDDFDPSHEEKLVGVLSHDDVLSHDEELADEDNDEHAPVNVPLGDGAATPEDVHLGILEGEDIMAAGERIAPIDSLWETKDALKKTLTNYGLSCGFKICSIGWSFTCNKAGKSRNRTNTSLLELKRQNGNRHLKVGCKMCVKYTYVDRTSSSKADKTGRARVTFAHYEHTSTCIPSANQLVVCRKASGDYAQISETMVNSILAVMEHDPGISTHALRAMVAPAFPKRKYISSMEIFNMKVRARLMMDEKARNGSLGKYKDSLGNIFKGLDDEDSDVIDYASRHGPSILRSVLSTTTQGWKIKLMLEKMHAADPGLPFEFPATLMVAQLGLFG
jgi:hypothetical protein